MNLIQIDFIYEIGNWGFYTWMSILVFRIDKQGFIVGMMSINLFRIKIKHWEVFGIDSIDFGQVDVGVLNFIIETHKED